MKIVIANSVGQDEDGNHYIHFPSRWTAGVGKTKDFTYYPYELAYLSSLLKAKTDHHVKMIDGNLLQLTPNKYIEVIAMEQPDWLIMETSTVLYLYDLKVAKEIKKRFGTKIIFAGPHPTAFPIEVLKDGIDYVCLGEYEESVLELMQGKDPQNILGIYPNKMRPLLDVNSLPFPEDNDISRFDYLYIGGCEYKEIEFFASRGCVSNCIFCVCGNMYYEKPNWRPRNIQSIINEIKYLKNKYPYMEGIFFDEEEHNVSKIFIKSLCKAIIENKLDALKYNAMCNYRFLDKSTLEVMKNAGYYKLRMGIETASEQVAKAMRKKISIPRLKEVLANAKEVGIKIYGTFTFGSIGSTKEEDKKTLDLIKELTDKGLLDDYQISTCTPQPGTPFYKLAEECGYLLTKDWTQYNGFNAVVSYPNYTNEEIEDAVRKASNIYFQLQIKRKGYLGLFLMGVKKWGLFYTLKKSILALIRYILR